MTRRLAPVVVLCAALASTAALAQAGSGDINDQSVHTRPQDLSLMLYLPWYYGIGFGINGRYEIPVLPDGFIPEINDEFSIEPSLGLAYSSWGPIGYSFNIFDITPAVYGLWSFHFSPKFRAYVGLGLGYNIAIFNAAGYPGSFNANFFYWDPVVGLYYNFAPNMGFRGELGAQGLKAGLAFYF